MAASTKIGKNSTLMVITFDSIDSITIKITFSESSHHYLSKDVSFAWFREV